MMRHAALLALLILAAPAPAQVVRGVLVDATSGAPVNGGIVVLLDASARQHAGGFTDAQGQFELRAPGAGRWRVRAEHVGYLGTMTPLLDVETGGVLDVRLELRRMAVRLTEIRVTEEKRCVINPERGVETARLWESVRTALRGTALTSEQRLGLRVATFERELDPQGAELWRRRRERTTFSETPFVSIPVEELEREGFVVSDGNTVDWRVPDAAVLLSERFLDTHCFRVAGAPSGSGDSLIGLAFEPSPGRTLADVRGVLWVDRESAELRRMEVRFVNLDQPVAEQHASGFVEFRRLPTGHWIVGRWAIRMPIIGERRISDLQGMHVRTERSLHLIREAGGEVVEILGKRTLSQAPSRITGTVFDSTRGVPLAGAHVFISGTPHAATSDSGGRFVLDGIPAGDHVVGFLHPRLDTLATVAPGAGVGVAGGDTAEVALAAPSWDTLIRAVCRDTLASGRGAVAGWVRSAETRLPIEEAYVTIFYSEPGMERGKEITRHRRADARTDREGSFRACGLPSLGRVRAIIGAHGYGSAELWIDVRPGELTRIDRALPREPGRTYIPPSDH